MMHYGIVQWVDFARGVAPEEERGGMAGHLSTGCPDCLQAAVFCETLARVCQGMALQSAPASASRLARAICPSRSPARPKRAFRIPVEVIFDSFLATAPAGLRATWQVGWQALYRAGDCSLDVRIEPDLRSSRAALIGQISNHAVPELQMAGMAVYLKSGRQVIAETRSNRFGEFQIEYEQQRRLQLCIHLGGGSRCIVTPLRKIAAERSGGARLKADARKQTDSRKNS
jgi:hypothetical protein